MSSPLPRPRAESDPVPVGRGHVRRPPNFRTVAQWIGSENHRRWDELARFIAEHYPGVFAPEWRLVDHGRTWALCYRRARSFCSLIPARGHFVLQIQLNDGEQARAEAVRSELVSHAAADYAAAPVGRGGRCLRLRIDDDAVLEDAKRLLAIKRPPKCVRE